MALTSLSIKQRLDGLLTGIAKTEIDDYTRDANIAGAIRRLSEDKPKLLVADITGDAGRYYKLTGTVASWDNDFSWITRILWDSGTLITGDELPEELEPEDWEIHRDSTDQYLLLKNSTLGTGKKIQLTYTALYALSAGSYDVPANALDALAFLAAAYSCRALAVGYSQHERASVLADSVDYASLTDKYTTLADAHEKQYRKLLGLDKDQEAAPRPSAVIVEWDTMPLHGRDYIFRRRRSR